MFKIMCCSRSNNFPTLVNLALLSMSIHTICSTSSPELHYALDDIWRNTMIFCNCIEFVKYLTFLNQYSKKLIMLIHICPLTIMHQRNHNTPHYFLRDRMHVLISFTCSFRYDLIIHMHSNVRYQHFGYWEPCYHSTYCLLDRGNSIETEENGKVWVINFFFSIV